MRHRLIPMLVIAAVLAGGCQPVNVRPEGPIEGAVFDALESALGLVSVEPVSGNPESGGIEGIAPIPWVLELGLPDVPRAVAVDPAVLGVDADCVDPGAPPSLPPFPPAEPPGDPGDVVVPVVAQEITWDLHESGRTLVDGDDFSVEESPKDAEQITATLTTLPTIVAQGSPKAVAGPEAPRRLVSVGITLAAQLADAPQLAGCEVDDEVVVSGGVTVFLDEIFELTKPYVRELPIVLGLAEHDDFKGGVLLLVPERMPYENEYPGSQAVAELRSVVDPLLRELNTVQEKLDEIRGTVHAAGSLLNLLVGLGILREAAAASSVRLTVVNEIPDMNTDDAGDGAPYQEAFSLCPSCGTFGNDIESEDEVSSLFLLGPGGERVSFYGADTFDDDEGHLSITVHATGFFVGIRNLGYEGFVGPVLVSPSDAGEVTGREALGTGKIEMCRPDEDRDWEDSFSSLKFFGPTCDA